MADDAVKTLVATLKLDPSGWDESVKEARAVLNSTDDEEKARQLASKNASAEAIASLKEQIAQQEVLKAQAAALAETERAKAEAAKATSEQTKAAAQVAVSAAQQQTAAEHAKLAATEAAAAANKAAADSAIAATRIQREQDEAAHAAKVAAMRDEQAILAKEIAERTLNIKKIQEEAAAERAKLAEEIHAQREAKESREGGLGGLFGGSLTTLAGGRGSLGGSLVGGIIGGAAGTAIFETVSEGLEKLTEKIKEFVEDSGGLQKVLETFQKLNEMKFGDNGLEFLEQLEEKTQHLVMETDLLRTANTFLGSSLKASKEQMLELTEATVGLARGRGLDATQAVKALDRVFLTGGRGVRQFSRLIGIQLPRDVASSLGPLATFTQKSQAEFDSLSKSVVTLYKSLGAPALTYTDRLKQISNASTEIFESLAQGAVHSTGFQLVSDYIGKLIEHLGDAQKVAYEFGQALGNAITPAVAAFKTLLPVAVLIKDAFMAVVDTVSSLLGSLESIGSNSGTDKIAENFAKLHPIVNALAKSFAILAGLVADTLNGFQTAVELVEAAKNTQKTTPGLDSPEFEAFMKQKGTPLTGSSFDRTKKYFFNAQANSDYTKFSEEWEKQHPKDQTKSFGAVFDAARGRANVAESIYKSADHLGLDYKKAQEEADKLLESFKNKHLDQNLKDPAAERREAIAEQKARFAEERKLSDAEFADTKEKIAIEEEANEALYKSGGEAAEKYYSKKKTLAAETLQATLAHIQEETEAQQKQYEFDRKLNTISPETFAIKTKTLGLEDQTKRINAQATYNKAISAASIGEREESTREQLAAIGIELDARKSALAQETAALKSSYAEQLISGKQYFDATLDLIYQNTNAVIDAENKKQAIGLKPTQLEGSLKVQQKAYEDAYKQLQELDDHFTQQQLSNTQKRFSNINSIISSTAELVGSEGGVGASPSTQLGFLQQQRDAADAQIQALEKLLSTSQQYSDTWFQIYNAILATTKQAQNLSDQMQQLSSYSSAAGNVLSSFAKSTQNVFTSRYGRGFVSAIGGAGESLSSAQQLVQQILGKKTPEVDKLKPYIDATKEATQGIIDSAKKSSSGLEQFAEQLQSAKDRLIEALNELADKLLGVVGPPKTSIDTNEIPESIRNRNIEIPEKNASVEIPESAKNTSIPDSIKAISPTAITTATPAIPVALTPSQVVPPSGQPPLSSAIVNGALPENTGISVPITTPKSSTDKTSITGIGPDQNDQETPIKQAGNGLLDFSKKLTGAINAVGGFISSISSAGSASAGAFGGGVSGAGLGEAAGSALGGPHGPLSSLGSFAGPFGAILGAGIGAALGGIMGQKQEQVIDDINKLDVTFKSVMNAYSTNNASLKQTIANLQALIAQAQADEASTKKGGQQFVDLIKQYNEQITQLQDQATQTMTQLQQQLDVITSPVPFQSLLSSVQQIIQQYTQFAGAAQNATDLANANQFLTQSLQNLGQTYTDQLRQDEESAIADALNLNELYNQRNQLQLQFLQSTEQILGQGTLTRQLTLSQTKFSQLYSLDVNHQNQLDALNQQINVAQYKVTAEQQIFNLATTKAGLEQQTLILQEQGINLDMARIAAMQSLLTTLQSTGFSITDLSGVNANDPNALMQLLLSLLLGQLSSSGAFQGFTAPNGQNNLLDTLVSGTYQSRAQYGYGGFRGTQL